MSKREIPLDPMAAALSEAERVQRLAIGAAAGAVRVALDALKPFDANRGRVLPGIDTAVSDVRDTLERCAANLEKIVTLHLTAKPAEPATPIEQHTDESHTAKVLAAKEAA